MPAIPVDISQIVDGDEIDASDVTVPLLQLQAAAQDTLEGGLDFERLSLISPSSIGIISGVITTTQLYHRVETEGSLPTDDLVTINATGNLLLLQLNTGGQSITLKHNTGNIWFNDLRDQILNDINQVIVLWFNESTSKWTGQGSGSGSIFLSDNVVGVLSSDTLTLTQTKMQVQSQSGLNDNLETISNPNNLDIALLSSASGSIITVKHNTGNIWFPNQIDYTLNPNVNTLMLAWNDTASKWIAIGIDYIPVVLPQVEGRDGLFLASFDKLVVPANSAVGLGSNDVELKYLTSPAWRRQLVTQVLEGTTYADIGGAFQLQGATVANADNADSSFITHTTSASNGNAQGRRTTTEPFQFRWSPSIEVVARVTLGNIGLSYFGFFDVNPGFTPSVPTFSGNGIFIVCKDLGGIEIRIFQGGSQLTGTPFGSLPSNLSSGVTYRIKMWINSTLTAVYGQIDNGTIFGITSITGLTTLATAPLFGGCLVVSDGSARALTLSRILLGVN